VAVSLLVRTSSRRMAAAFSISMSWASVENLHSHARNVMHEKPSRRRPRA
jgi:hypothetical protein